MGIPVTVPTNKTVDELWEEGLGAACLGDHRSALASLRQVLKQEERAEYWAVLGIAYDHADDLDGALECLKRACDMEPRCGRYRADLAGILYRMGRVDQAIFFYNEAVTAEPDHAEHYHGLGNAHYYGRRDFGEAARAYAQAVRRNPFSAEYQGRLGRALHLAGHAAQAAEALGIACLLERSDPSLHLDLARSRLEARDLESSIAAAREALHLGARADACHEIVARALLLKGEPRAALQALGRAIAACADRAALHFLQGRIQAEMGDHEKAARSFQRAALLEPESASAWYNVGSSFLEAGCPYRARGPLRRSAQLDPTRGDAWNNLALCQALVGEREAARESIRHALAACPTSSQYLQTAGFIEEKGA